MTKQVVKENIACKVAVVILNWNGKKLLEAFLSQVVEHSRLLNGESQVILADNGSTDGSLDYVRMMFPRTVRCIDLKANHGFAEGYNRALAFVEAEYVVLLNSDVEVTAGWLDCLIGYMDKNQEVAACQPKIRSLTDRSRFEHAGAAGGYLDALGYPFCRGRLVKTVEVDDGQYDGVSDIFWASGACLLIRQAVYNEVGGLDARFFAHMEEIDLCWRLRSRGYRIVCLPESCVYHLGGATLNVGSPRKTYLNYRNNLFMLYKNLPAGKLVPVFLIRLVMDYLSAFIFLISGKYQDASAVFRARWHFWQQRTGFNPQRSENITAARLNKIPEMYRGSIVLDYYLFGIRFFSALKMNKKA